MGQNQSIHGNWDSFKIEQVVINLLTNATRYGRGKPVYLSFKREGQMAHIIIRDQGMGIAKENQARIFQRFERAISANEISGLGLGLYIADQIVTMHGGKIRVESEVGQGATFIVELPLDHKQPYS